MAKQEKRNPYGDGYGGAGNYGGGSDYGYEGGQLSKSPSVKAWKVYIS